MDLPQLIAALAVPRAYPFPAGAVEVRQTHISVVFLAGEYAYKVKKPVSMGFLDFGTLEKRRACCDQEVGLNRRLAPDVYLGVVPVTRHAAGVAVEGDGPVVEWAVKMRRLPDAATLLAGLSRGEVSAPVVEKLATRLAAFHARAEGGGRVAGFGRFDVVAGNARENFSQAEPLVGRAISRPVFERLRGLTDAALDRLRPLIEARAAAGVPRDTHGDLHADHVYLFPDRAPPGDVVIIDCVEFNERFRYADPVADMAFLVMDLSFHGRRDLAGKFADAYFLADGDTAGRELLPFYSAYRAAVRGKVDGFQLGEAEVPEEERAATLRRARAHWLFALGELEDPNRRPCLVLIGGLPGTGKSTLSARLAERAGFTVVRTDAVRKELSGLPAATSASADYGAGIYRPEVTERTYAECLRRAERVLFEGGRVIVDASFGEEQNRRAFLDAAARLAAPGAFVHCKAPPDVSRTRLAGRRGDDASDADWSIYQRAAEHWQPSGLQTQLATLTVETVDGAEAATAQVMKHLGGLGLQVSPSR